jgi:hypothetical protein
MAKIQKEEKKGDRLRKQAAPELVTQKLDSWLGRNDKTLFPFFCILTVLFSLVLFNARVSEGGDDATYIKAGYDYSKNFTTYYFSFNAPGYPMFLSLPIKLFGLNLLLLKFLSVIFYFFGFYFLYKALRGRIRNVIFYPVMFIVAVNAYAQYYASQTYNESFYLFFQGLFFFVFFKLEDSINEEGESIKLHWKRWLQLGLLLFVLAFVKNLAIVAVPAVAVYFLINKRFLSAGYTCLAYLAIKLPFEGIKRVIWGNISQFSAQGDILKLRDPYDRSKGYEDVSGYFGRLFDNINIYLGKRFWEIMGFFGKDPAVDDTSKELYAFLAKIVLLVFVAIFIALVIRRKNKSLLLISFYSLAMLFISFFALQARWDQPRIIIIFLPFMVILLFYALLSLFERFSLGASLYLVIVFIFAASSVTSAFKHSGENLPYLSKNLRGDQYAGYTPDWVNFLKMSRWCADSLPKDAYVASRKAPMSFIYGKGKEFFPVYRVLAYDTATRQSNPDSVLAIFKRNKVTHIIYASIRIDPNHNTGQIINTMNNLFDPIRQKYPGKVVLIHQEGEAEPALLFEIKP